MSDIPTFLQIIAYVFLAELALAGLLLVLRMVNWIVDEWTWSGILPDKVSPKTEDMRARAARTFAEQELDSPILSEGIPDDSVKES